jgi:hexosaminidase
MERKKKTKRLMYRLIIILFAMAVLNSYAQTTPVSIIPEPANIVFGNGIFTIDSTTVIYFNSANLIPDIALFNDHLVKYYGVRLSAKQDKRQKGINLSLDNSMVLDNYKLTVDSDGVFIRGGAGAGVFYGLQTLIQMLPAGRNALRIPFVSIEDKPRFSYRGMHLDVVRHFFPVEAVKRYIDNVARYKMNTLHWHLTDDQGWRIEIKKYPKLQSISAWRNGTLIGHFHDQPAVYDTIRYGGYYTQKEIRDIVNYAYQRHISIIPEVEMPGHAQAVLAAYPELSCTGGPFETGKTWGVYKDVFCTKDATFEFLENVLDEVCDLFPGKYIHIGGDECPKDRWKECPGDQQRMKLENTDAEGLQHYFTNRIINYLKTKNKIAIGWDEIMDDKLDSQAVVMSWRGYNGGVQAATKGHDVIMAPASHVYFDMYQSRNTGGRVAIGGYLPIDVVYNFEPVPDVLNEEQSEHILGAQGNVWTEYITTEERLNEMVFPRICALSEVLWTPKSKRDFNAFARKMLLHFKMLRFMKINFSTSLFDISSHVLPNGDKGISVELTAMYPQGRIFYTINGEEPSLHSTPYTGKINLEQSAGVKAALYEGTEKRGETYNQIFSITKSTGKEVTLKTAPHPEYSRGGAMALVDGSKGGLPWIPSEWLGFQAADLDATIDLGSVQTISIVAVDALKDEEGKIFLPSEVTVSVSNDGKAYEEVAKVDSSAINKMQRNLKLRFNPINSRYVKVVAKNDKGFWLFADEIEVE